MSTPPAAVKYQTRPAPEALHGNRFACLRRALVLLALLVPGLLLPAMAHAALDNLFGNSEQPLPVEQAFVASASPGTQPDTLQIDFEIADGYYLYQHKLSFETSPGTAGTPQLPAGEAHEDDFFGRTTVYRERANIVLPVTGAAGQSVELAVNYQGCADLGICYPPTTSLISVALPAAAGPGDGGSADTTGTGAGLDQSEQDRLASRLASGSLWLNAGLFYVLGLLLAFTPCVLPMVPILSSLIVGQQQDGKSTNGFRLSLVYVLAMAMTYTALGVLVAMSGFNIQAWFQQPTILIGFAALFVLLSLAMFGLYELQLPAALQQRLTRVSNSQSAGSYRGVATMGLLSALIVGPCVTAPLVGVLIYIAESGNALVGAVALFCLAMGMGTPLLLIGASAGRWLPRAGAWMDRVKGVFGLLLLAMAIWLLDRILPASVTLSLAAVLAVIGGIYLGAADALSPNSGNGQRLAKGAGIVVSLYGVALMVSALSGHPSFLRPLGGLGGVAAGVATDGTESAHADLPFVSVKGVDQLDQAVARAAAEGKPVMLDFYADWCVSCKEMEAFTFTDPTVQARLANVVLLRTDVTPNDTQDQAMLKRFGLFGPPAIIFYDPEGQELPAGRIVGFKAADAFAAHVEAVLGEAVMRTAAR